MHVPKCLLKHDIKSLVMKVNMLDTASVILCKRTHTHTYIIILYRLAVRILNTHVSIIITSHDRPSVTQNPEEPFSNTGK